MSAAVSIISTSISLIIIPLSIVQGNNNKGWSDGDPGDWNPGHPNVVDRPSSDKGPLGGWDDDIGGENWSKGSPYPGQGPPKDEVGWGIEDSIPGVPGQSYPNYDSIPRTSFDCRIQRHPGYYGDPEAKCQVFHICQADGRHNSFLCPVGTIFNQETFVCDWWFNVNCADTSRHYNRNEDLYRETPPSRTRTTKGDSAPARSWGQQQGGVQGQRVGTPSWDSGMDQKGRRPDGQFARGRPRLDIPPQQTPRNQWDSGSKGSGSPAIDPPTPSDRQRPNIPSGGSNTKGDQGRGFDRRWDSRDPQGPRPKGANLPGMTEMGGRGGYPGPKPKPRRRVAGNSNRRRRRMKGSPRNTGSFDRSSYMITRSAWSRDINSQTQGPIRSDQAKGAQQGVDWPDVGNSQGNYPVTPGNDATKGSFGWPDPGSFPDSPRPNVDPNDDAYRRDERPDQENLWSFQGQQEPQQPVQPQRPKGWTDQWDATRLNNDVYHGGVQGSNNYYYTYGHVLSPDEDYEYEWS